MSVSIPYAYTPNITTVISLFENTTGQNILHNTNDTSSSNSSNRIMLSTINIIISVITISVIIIIIIIIIIQARGRRLHTRNHKGDC